jgi:hypothetical protein
MAKREIKFEVQSRRSGKTLQVQEALKAAMERGEKIYLPTSPPISDDGANS